VTAGQANIYPHLLALISWLKVLPGYAKRFGFWRLLWFVRFEFANSALRFRIERLCKQVWPPR
jgi:hypothetical protein